MRVHLDTDLGGDIDDAFALAMLLGWPGVELVGITTVADPVGQRAGYVSHCLALAGRDDIPLAAGAGVSLTTLASAQPVTNDERYWPHELAHRPAPPGAALDLLHASIESGATIVAIGPWTNLAVLEVARPGSLGRAPVVVMGGWTGPPPPGLPQWGPEMDFNVQWDPRAAQIVATSARPTMVPLPVTLKAHLRAADLARLRGSGPFGELLASQGEAHGHDHDMTKLGRAHTALPDDLLNFQHDPVACAVAVNWPGVVIEDMDLQAVDREGVLRFQRSSAGRHTRLVVDIDADTFTEAWLTAVEAAQLSTG